MDQPIQDFLVSLVAQQHASPNTLGAYRVDLRQLVDYLRRNQVTAWTDVGAQMLEDFAAHLVEREYATASIARKLAATRSFFQYLYRSGAITADPAVSLVLPRVEKGAPQLLSQQEVARLFRQASSSTPAGLRDAAMLHLLYATGLRVSELVALTLTDLDDDLTRLRCVAPHGRERFLPLSPAAQRALRAYLDRGRRRLAGGRVSDAIFLNHRGERLTRQGFWLIVKGHARAAGLGDITPHTLRHAFALNLLGQGMQLRGVQEMLGHANISSTQIYRQLQRTHADPPGAEAAPGTLGAAENDHGTDAAAHEPGQEEEDTG
jgi:integrase/recombinase XerD